MTSYSARNNSLLWRVEFDMRGMEAGRDFVFTDGSVHIIDNSDD